MAEKTLFQKIEAGEIPAKIEYQDEQCFAIRDISPQAPQHLLIIPRKVLPRLAEATEGDEGLLGHLLIVAGKLAKQPEFSEGYRVVINNGPHGGESVPHLHVHLLGGRQLHWPPG